MLFIPNAIWTKNQPKEYEKYAQNENKVLQILEKIGEVLVCCFVLIFSDFNIRFTSVWSLWLVLSFILMLLYEIYWIQYFNTYYQGYNASLGGSGHVKYNYDDIVNFYLVNNFSIKDTCQHFNIYDQVVYSALKSKNIDYKALSQKGGKKVGKRIMLVEKNLIFNSMKEIDEYFGKQVHGNIRRCLNGMTQKAYGYTWKELEDNG
jgi:hypothetical protein